MKHGLKFGLVALVAGAASFMTPGDTHSADAARFISLPIGYPIADCGTVGLVDSFIPFPGGEPQGGCLAWFPDNSPGAYIVAGLDAFNVGDRVFVTGLICSNCLTSCAAGAILDGQITPCSEDDK